MSKSPEKSPEDKVFYDGEWWDRNVYLAILFGDMQEQGFSGTLPSQPKDQPKPRYTFDSEAYFSIGQFLDPSSSDSESE